MVELRLAPRGDDGRVLVLPPVDGPCWASDCLAISREWIAFKEHPRRASWNVVPYAAVLSVGPGTANGIVDVRPDGSGVVIGVQALASLEACTVLAEGLGTNPAVAPDAAGLLQPHLERARAKRESSLARLHRVDRSGTTHTFRVHRRVVLAVICMVIGALFLPWGIAALFNPAAFQLNAWQELLFIGMGLFFMWAGICAFRGGVQVRGGKLIIRNELWARTIPASDILAITLEPKAVSEVATHWKPRVELTNGRSIWIDHLDCGPVKRPPQPDRAAAVEEIRALLGVRPGDSSAPKSPHPGGAAE